MKFSLHKSFRYTACFLLSVGALCGSLCNNIEANPAVAQLLEVGKRAYNQGRYKESLENLQQAASKEPRNVETQMWLGLALHAAGREWEAMAAWRNGVGNARWEPTADYLRGMAWWKMNRANDALAYFKEAEVNTLDGKIVRFAPAREAILMLQSGKNVADISRWPQLSQLSKKTSVSSNGAKTRSLGSAPAKTTVKPVGSRANIKKPAGSSKLAPAPQSATSRAKKVLPRSGRWVATVHNGYKGDTLTFRVSADGKRVENVEFKGHWMNRDSASRMAAEVLRNLDPPAPFTVSGGSFSGVQQVPKSRMWWEFAGRFTGATSAEGTYRCAYAGGINDTYKLKWTARYAG